MKFNIYTSVVKAIMTTIGCLLCVTDSQAVIGSISIITDRENMLNSISNSAMKDCVDLLKRACNCDVRLNNEKAEILLKMPTIRDIHNDEPSRFAINAPYPYLRYPDHDYRWISYQEGDQTLLELETRSFNGISFGLYGLLQEHLWFGFFHPKETYIPKLDYWPLTETFTWMARARFDKKGFHLHTMHPTELTECLLDVDYKNGIADAKEYIDWLARNQQNYFEFNLLEGIDKERWIGYIKPLVDYAHSRGVLMGVDISMHMTQQKAYMLYRLPPFVWKSKKKQISKNVDYLSGAKWDVLNVEFATTEFSSGNLKKKYEMRQYLSELLEFRKIKLMGREHVVTDANKLDAKRNQRFAAALEEEFGKLDKARGTLIHTVMFYSMLDKKAPVYGNENLLHTRDRLIQARHEREAWYYPESAYWITFDNSVPMTLLPYLTARLDDIELADSLDIKGHVTFSSGWEWGYWLTDWSIARWSWKHEFNGEVQQNYPFQYVTDIFNDPIIAQQLTDALRLQQTYLKDLELIRYVAAATVTDELPKPLNMPFQPRPKQSYKELRYKASEQLLDSVRDHVIDPLREFARKSEYVAKQLENQLPNLTNEQHKKLLLEFVRGIYITALRAEHRASTLSHLAAKRQAELDKEKVPEDSEDLRNAVAVRQKALVLVAEQEKNYRYSLDMIARTLDGKGHTAYDFGYLYPTQELLFWQREEEQVRNDKYGAFYRLIWDIPTIIGLTD